MALRALSKGFWFREPKVIQILMPISDEKDANYRECWVMRSISIFEKSKIMNDRFIHLEVLQVAWIRLNRL